MAAGKTKSMSNDDQADIASNADNGHKMIDLTESIQTYYDFTGTPFRMESQNGDYKLVDLDLGLFWTISDALRIELHTRFPFVTMSWKF